MTDTSFDLNTLLELIHLEDWEQVSNETVAELSNGKEVGEDGQQ